MKTIKELKTLLTGILVVLGIIFSFDMAEAELEGPDRYFASSGPTWGLSIGDVTGDGLNDVVVGDGNFMISVFEQQADGRFIETAYEAGRVIDEVALGDFNNDGLLDVAALDRRGEPGIRIFYQNESGKLDSPVIIPIGGLSSAVAGDFNNDGLDDLAVLLLLSDGMQYLNGKVCILYQQPGGLNNEPEIYDLDRIGCKIMKGDFNNDGLDDFVISESSRNIGYRQYGTGGIDIFLQLANGGFEINYYEPETGKGYRDMTVNDLNNDGLDDIAMRSGSKVDIFVQTADGEMIRDYQIECAGTWFISSGDVTGDGLNDVVVSVRNGDGFYGVVVFEQYNDNGEIEFIESNRYPVLYNSRRIEVGDLNNDGEDDVVVTTYNQNTITIFSQVVPLKVVVDEIESPVMEGSEFTVKWTVNKDVDKENTNVLLDGIETPGYPEKEGDLYEKVVKAPYGDSAIVEVFASRDGDLAYSEPQIIELLPAIKLKIIWYPKYVIYKKPFLIIWHVDTCVDDTYISLGFDPENLNKTGKHFKGIGFFKDKFKAKKLLKKKCLNNIYFRVNALIGNRHYKTEVKVIKVLSKGKGKCKKKARKKAEVAQKMVDEIVYNYVFCDEQVEEVEADSTELTEQSVEQTKGDTRGIKSTRRKMMMFSHAKFWHFKSKDIELGKAYKLKELLEMEE